MTILFAASEVGSARALLPVARAGATRGTDFRLLRRGYLACEAGDLAQALADCPEDSGEMRSWLRSLGVRVLVFSSNIADTLPLRLARAAREEGLPCLHVLDYWANCANRMRMDGGPLFQPEVYAVPDDAGLRLTVAEGLDPARVRITGQPAFADAEAAFEAAAARSPEEVLGPLGLDPDRRTVLFISEPAAMDQGTGPENPAYRGYTERDALTLFAAGLMRSGNAPQALILPHPREDDAALAAAWDSLGDAGRGVVASGLRGRDLLPFACGVVGMASTLLYEALLAGRPVASIQPGLRHEHLKILHGREGVLFLDQAEGAAPRLSAWLDDLEPVDPGRRGPDLALHAGAAEAILDIALQLANAPRGGAHD